MATVVHTTGELPLGNQQVDGARVEAVETEHEDPAAGRRRAAGEEESGEEEERESAPHTGPGYTTALPGHWKAEGGKRCPRIS